jgi:hypothetical protein
MALLLVSNKDKHEYLLNNDINIQVAQQQVT